MRLQLAIDTLILSEAFDLLDRLQTGIDIVEVGTPLIIREGLRAVTEIDRRYPYLTTLADLKIMDAGAYEAGLAFDAGADIVTVLAVAHDDTVSGVVRAARDRSRQVVADLIAVHSPVTRARELDALGVDYVCVHTATDTPDTSGPSAETIRAVRATTTRCGVAVAGGLTPERMDAFASFPPDIVIVGSFITRHPDPEQAVSAIRKRIDEKERGSSPQQADGFSATKEIQ
ncbi:MAG: orotidine 5'-phosphate decarboxylase [candidate division Zixibacteria bacterium]|nr:orotidine 5'-phosphate decarboxylase [candidate division Zixibacteria bacterium]